MCIHWSHTTIHPVFCGFLIFFFFFFTPLVFSHISEVPKLSSYAKAEDRLFKYLFGNYQKWVRPVEHLNQTIRVKFGLAISQLVDVVRTEAIDIVMAMIDYITSWVTHSHPSPNCAKVKPKYPGSKCCYFGYFES